MPAERLNAKDAAKLFDCGPAQIKNWCAAGAPHERGHIRDAPGGKPSLLIDPEKFREWLIVNNKAGYRKSLLNIASEAAAALPPQEPEKRVFQIDNSLGLQGAINRVRAAERDSFSKYLEAKRLNNMQLERARLLLYVESAKALKALESVYDDRKEVEAGIWERVQKQLVDWAEVVRSAFDQMPHSLAPRCNPQNPSDAEKVLVEWLNNQALPVMQRPLK